eukprot:11246475-Ditylum_brightwellii.AAC.1
MRSVHECTDMVVVEDVVERSEFFGNDDEWEEEGIFGTGNLEDMNNFDVDVGVEDDWEDEGIVYSCTEHNDEDKDVCNDELKSVLEDDWEDEGIFMTSREQINVDGELWDDDESMNSEESSNAGDGRRRR